MNTICYGMFVFLWGLTKGIDIGVPSGLSTACVLAGGIFWLLKVGGTRYSTKEKCVNVLFFLIGIISYYMIHRMGVLVAVMVVIGAKGVDYKQVLKILLLLQIILMVSRVVPELIGVSQGEGWSGLYQGRKLLGVLGENVQYRMSFGFYHPNEFHRAVFTITALITCIYYGNLKNWQILILFLINALAYVFAFSNTALVISMFFFFVVWNIRRYNCIGVNICKISKFIFLFIVISIVLICIIYSNDNRLLYGLNQLLTGRIQWANEYINAAQLSLWGRNIDNIQVPYIGLDCGYIHILLRYGAVVLIVYCFAVYRLFNIMFGKRLYVEIVLLLSLHFYFVMENFLLIAFQNYTWVLLGALLYCNNCDNHREIRGFLGK